jgi:hypothetical protein
LPKTVIRFAPMRFCISADHFRSATVRREAETMSRISIRVTTLAMDAP